jgi:hypothetical protein
MEVGLVENVSSLERANMMMHLNKSALEGRLVLEDDKHSHNEKLSQAKSLANGMVDIGLYDNQSEDEGEIMLLAMILLQLHGVKLPVESPNDNESGTNSKKKRQRTSPEQLAILEQIFQTDKMPNQQTRVQLADQLGMSSRRVQIWFQNKRAKVKRSQMKEGSADGSPSSSQNGLRDSTSSSPSSPSSPVPEDETLSPISSPNPMVLVPQNMPIMQQQQPQQQQQQQQAPLAPITSTSATKVHQATSQTVASFSSSQLQFSLTSFESSQPLLLPNEYNTLRLQSMLKN